MDNEEIKSGSEEEYHFPEEEIQPNFSTAPSAGDSATINSEQAASRKRLLIAIAVIVAIFCIYKLADVLLTSRGREHLSTTTTTTTTQLPIQSAPTNQMPAVPTTSTSVTTAPIKPAEIMESPVSDRISNLERQNSASQDQIDRLSSQLNTVQSSLTDLTAKVSSMTDSVQGLAATVTTEEKQQAAELITQEKKVRITTGPRKAYYRPRPIYFVRAMIQGRAWLATENGGTLTVNLGDIVPGYGVVVAINPSQGLLATSSGAIIGYSPNDS